MKRSLLPIALKLAQFANKKLKCDYRRHFTFVVQDNQIIEFSTNKLGNALKHFGYKNHQMLHSEFTAYKKAKGLLDKYKPFEIINIRLKRLNEIKISKPCPCCFNFLKNLNCKKVYYTTDEGEFKVMKL